MRDRKARPDRSPSRRFETITTNVLAALSIAAQAEHDARAHRNGPRVDQAGPPATDDAARAPRAKL